MPRPALAGTRALDVIDVLAAHPGKAFTFSELVRATGSNYASCHAVLGVLVARNYLDRDETRMTYTLGPALYAAGQAMFLQDALLQALVPAVEGLAHRLGRTIAISARSGDELVGLARLGPDPLKGRGLAVGQRVPLKPPIGATLVAWSTDEEIELWIARGDLDPEREAAARLRQDLAAIRMRGYLATLQNDSYAAISSAVTPRGSGASPQERRDHIIAKLYGGLFQPEEIQPDRIYDLANIGAPVFDRSGRPAYSIVISGFGGPMNGGDVQSEAGQLTRLCSDMVRFNGVARRGAAPDRRRPK